MLNINEIDIDELNHKISVYNWQSAVMNGTIGGLPNITEQTSDIDKAYIKGRIDEHFIDEIEDEDDEVDE